MEEAAAPAACIAFMASATVSSLVVLRKLHEGDEIIFAEAHEILMQLAADGLDEGAARLGTVLGPSHKILHRTLGVAPLKHVERHDRSSPSLVSPEGFPGDLRGA
jgi:hypothetical protein